MNATDKQRRVLSAFEREPARRFEDIAAEAGVSRTHATNVINEQFGGGERQRRVDARKAAQTERQSEHLLPAPTNGQLARITDLEPRRNYWAVQFGEAQCAEHDRKVLQGKGFTGYWEDNAIVGMLDGVVATIGGLLTLLTQSRSQVAWEGHAREAILYAAFCESSVLPVAKRGIYRGLRGDEYFGQVANYIRERIALGPLG
jgi:hypothetical protein